MNLEKEDDESEKTNNNTIFGGKASVYANLTSNVYMRRDENSHPRYGHYFFSIGIHLNQDYCEIDLAKRL